jgi:riboflavin biosynthesis pyrimidine reductase
MGLCMVASLDGSTTVDGMSSGLSSPNDVEVLLTLRSLADMIIVGAGTVRDENYGAPAKPGQRIGVVTNSGTLDYESALFTSGAGFLICPESTPAVPVETLRVGEREVDLVEAMHRLGEVSEVDFVQLEGGAKLNAGLATADLIDEVNLTISPRIAGGQGPRLTTGAPPLADRNYQLAHLVVDEYDFVFSRWTRRQAS